MFHPTSIAACFITIFVQPQFVQLDKTVNSDQFFPSPGIILALEETNLDK